MSEQRYLIDIERFVKWTYNNPKLFNGESAVFSKSAERNGDVMNLYQAKK